METSMYYTFSTIAQVLGALVALSGVFVVFKLQALNGADLNIVEDFGNQIKELVEKGELPKDDDYLCAVIYKEVAIAHRARNLNGMTAKLEKVLSTDEVKKSSHEIVLSMILGSFKKSRKLRKLVIASAAVSMLSGAITIIMSILVLHNVPSILYMCCISAMLNSFLFCCCLSGLIVSICSMAVTVYCSFLD